MNKDEYMKALCEALNKYDKDVQDEIVNDYEEHFMSGKMEGKTDEQIIKELGDIDELVSELDGFAEYKAKIEETGIVPVKTIDDSEKKSEKESFTFNSETAKKVAFQVAEALGKAVAQISDATEKIAQKSTKIVKEVAENYQNGYANGNHDSTKKTETKEGAIFTTATKVSVSSRAMDVKIGKSDDGDVHYTYTMTGTAAQLLAFKFEIRDNGDEVIVKMDKDYSNTQFFQFMKDPVAKVCLLLPETVKEFKFNSLSGDLEMKNVNLDKITINTASGDVVSKNSNSKVMEFNTASGDVCIDGSALKIIANTASGDISIDGLTEEVSINTASGDVEVKTDTIKKVNVATASGDVEFKIGKLSGYSVVMSAASGDSDFSFGHEHHSGLKKGSFTFGVPEAEFNFRTMSGDICVECK